MRHVIIGTAGHVDHGKTALIRALTGIETDRLEEERRRGLSIELGFAYFDLPDGSRAGIVDVPGHERFIRNMLSGAYGMDVVLLVMDAREGVQPQTQEHLDILDLLGVSTGILVVTKIDLVSPERREEALEEAQLLVDGTTLEGSPIAPVSSITGEGIEELKRSIVKRVDEIVSQRSAQGVPRLYIDRVFTMEGFGVVTTGTLHGGSLSRDQRVHVLPSKLPTRVRGIQTHNVQVDTAFPGQRTALNLTDVSRDEVSRGDVVCPVDIQQTTSNMDVMIRVLPSIPRMVEHWNRARLYLGTMEAFCRIVLLNEEALLPEDQAIVQLRLERPITSFRGDRFVLRDFTAQYTLGGGYVLDPFAVRHKRFTPETEALAERWREADEEQTVELVLETRRELSLPESLLRYYLPYTDRALDKFMTQLEQDGLIIRWREATPFFSSAQRVDATETALRELLEEFHQQNPHVAGQNVSQVRLELGVEEEGFDRLVRRMIQLEEIVKDGTLLRLCTHEISFSDKTEAIRTELEDAYLGHGFGPPAHEEIWRQLKEYERSAVQETFYALVKLGLLVKISDSFYLHKEVLDGQVHRLVEYLKQHEQITVAEFREMAQSSRKYTVPFLEYCDSQGITLRDGNHRRLRTSHNV